MSAVYAWASISVAIFVGLLGLANLIGAAASFAAAGDSKEWKEDTFHRSWAISRMWRGLPAFGFSIALLVALGVEGWAFTAAHAAIALVSSFVVFGIYQFGPPSPRASDFYTKDELDKKLDGLLQDEIQKLLGRVGAFSGKARSDDAYRELDAMNELEEYLKNRIEKTEAQKRRDQQKQYASTRK